MRSQKEWGEKRRITPILPGILRIKNLTHLIKLLMILKLKKQKYLKHKFENFIVSQKGIKNSIQECSSCCNSYFQTDYRYKWDCHVFYIRSPNYFLF